MWHYLAALQSLNSFLSMYALALKTSSICVRHLTCDRGYGNAPQELVDRVRTLLALGADLDASAASRQLAWLIVQGRKVRSCGVLSIILAALAMRLFWREVLRLSVGMHRIGHTELSPSTIRSQQTNCHRAVLQPNMAGQTMWVLT